MDKHVYIAGPMRDLPQFNFPSFIAAEIALLAKGGWTTIFSPAQHDMEKHGAEPFLSSTSGDMADIEHLGFDIRDAMATDLEWIARNATHMYMLRGWENSRGARAELALAIALDIEIIYQPDVEGSPIEGPDLTMTPEMAEGHTIGYALGWADGRADLTAEQKERMQQAKAQHKDWLND